MVGDFFGHWQREVAHPCPLELMANVLLFFRQRTTVDAARVVVGIVVALCFVGATQGTKQDGVQQGRVFLFGATKAVGQATVLVLVLGNSADGVPLGWSVLGCGSTCVDTGVVEWLGKNF